MNRRTILQMLGALPFMGLAYEEEVAEAQEPALVEPQSFQWPESEPMPDTVEIFTEWQPMAERLWANFQEFAALQPDWWQPDDMNLGMPICYRFCQALLSKEPSPFGPGDTAGAFFPHQDPHLIRDNVSFGVAQFPIVWRKGQMKLAESRRVRMAPLQRLREVMEDFSAFHGLDVEVELVTTLAQEAAFEVEMEIRKDFDAGVKVHTYALYQPPFLSAVDPKMIEQGFSVDRRWRMRYAKFA